jgi:hypothetical protein
MKIRINKQLEMLCKILDTTPQQILQEFADNLSLDYRYTSGSDERRMAIEYFMRCGYGMHRFDFEQVEQMFDELNAIRSNYYNYGNAREKEYLQERDRRYKEFFTHWKARAKK